MSELIAIGVLVIAACAVYATRLLSLISRQLDEIEQCARYAASGQWGEARYPK